MADRTKAPTRLVVALVWAAVAAVALAGCAGGTSDLDRAKAQVSAKEKALAQAQDDFTAASAQFCQAGKTYIDALDRYGDVLHDTAPTVGDVKNAGADLVAPRKDAFDGADAAVEARDAVEVAQQDLADAQAKLAAVEAGPSASASVSPAPVPSSTPLASGASVERVKQAESEFTSATDAVTDQTPLTDAAELFNSAAVALELAWLGLFVDAGCATDEQVQQASAAVSAYTTALQQELLVTGYYSGEVDGVYGPMTVQAVQDLQSASGLPVTGTMDKATTEALQAELAALSGAAAQESVASTAAVQQTLALVGFWDGPVDGIWTPELTDAVKAFQVELGVEPTGTVDAATISAFEQAIAALPAPAPSPSTTP